jgi:hypothetical protein
LLFTQSLPGHRQQWPWTASTWNFPDSHCERAMFSHDSVPVSTSVPDDANRAAPG